MTVEQESNPNDVPEERALANWHHHHNVVIGRGRIIAVKGAGWALPGGRLTSERSEAERVARAIDQFTRDHEAHSFN